jgi:acyl-CoA synthetase (AMP-forming)/AMP-acid ligase II
MQKVLQAKIYAELERAPDRRCFGFVDGQGAVRWRTGEEFFRRAEHHAAHLQAAGLGRGDVCVIVLPSKEHSATTLMASLLLGAIPLMVAPPMIQGGLSSLTTILLRTVRKTRARVVVCDDSLADIVGDLRRSRRATRCLVGEHAFEGDAGRVAPVTPDEGDVAAYQLTSGTTGFPRVCVWRQRGVIAALDGMLPAMDLGRDDVCFNWTPLYHDMGLVNNFFLCLANGIPMVMMSPQDFVRRPALWLRGLWQTGSTVTWSPNFGFALAAKAASDKDLEGVRLDGVKGFWNAAERIHLETIRQFRDRFAPYGVRPEAVKTNFGCAENVGGATFSDPHGDIVYERVDRNALQEKRVAVPVAGDGDGRATMTVVSAGRAAPGIDLLILSRTGKPLADGHVGEVALRTPSRLERYLGNGKATARARLRDLLRTGDLGYLRNGELFWVGRVRERIAMFGKKVDPSDFERVLLGVDGLRPGCFAAFGVDDAERGTQRMVVVSEVRDDTSREADEIASDVRDHVGRELGIDVSEVLLVPKGTLTKTSSGKRRHRHFRQLYLEGNLQKHQLQLQNV